MLKGGISFFILLCLMTVQSCAQSPSEILNYATGFNDNSKKNTKYSQSKYKQSQQTSKKKYPVARPVSKPARYKKISKYITVNKGDQLYVLANKYNVSSSAIIKLNKLKPPYDLQTGQKLRLPNTLFHLIKKGESLYEISRKYGVGISRLVKVNGLRKPYNINAGQKLIIPYRSYAKNTSSTKKNQYTHKKKFKPVKKQQTNYKKISSKAFSSKGKGPSKFYWPLKGKIISSFGNKGKGISNEGINISAKNGANIRASALGIVVYVGSELKRYGNLLILRHGGGWLTAYAHQRETLVSKGTVVKRGQIIGKVGKSGKVDKPQLHFSIRKGRKAVDPMKLLQ